MHLVRFTDLERLFLVELFARMAVTVINDRKFGSSRSYLAKSSDRFQQWPPIPPATFYFAFEFYTRIVCIGIAVEPLFDLICNAFVIFYASSRYSGVCYTSSTFTRIIVSNLYSRRTTTKIRFFNMHEFYFAGLRILYIYIYL